MDTRGIDIIKQSRYLYSFYFFYLFFMLNLTIDRHDREQFYNNNTNKKLNIIINSSTLHRLLSY